MSSFCVWIAGGCGFVGTNLALYLNKRFPDWKIICIDPLQKFGTTYNRRVIMEEQAWEIELVLDKIQRAESHCSQAPDIILNCAAQSGSMKGMTRPEVDFEANTEAVLSILRLCDKYKVPLIHWSTNKVYPASSVNRWNTFKQETRYRVDELQYSTATNFPISGSSARSVYGCTKYLAEVLIREWADSFGVISIVNRFSCIAGPNQYSMSDQAWLAHWVISHHFEKPLTYFGWNGCQVRDILNIDDLCDLVSNQVQRLCTDRLQAGVPRVTRSEVYNVGGGNHNTLSLIEATDLCQEVTGKRCEVSYNPTPRPSDQRVYVSDITPVRAAFDWNPTRSPRDTVESIYKWVLDNEDTLRSLYT